MGCRRGWWYRYGGGGGVVRTRRFFGFSKFQLVGGDFHHFFNPIVGPNRVYGPASLILNLDIGSNRFDHFRKGNAPFVE